MLGDYYQLNPVIRSYEADKKGMSISLFRKLCERHPYKVMILRQSYTMNENIASLSNTIAYKGLIRHANPEIRDMQLIFDEGKDWAPFPWLKELKNEERRVTLINTDNLLNKTL
jgi:DNA replication ATP-dependent helicase Dna2